MNPFVRMLSTDELMRSLMYETLFNFDLKEKIVPSLGESWTISKDGLEYTVKLRQGVKFHNGQEVTPDDGSGALTTKWIRRLALRVVC